MNKECDPKITVTEMTEEEFRKLHPDAIEIKSEEDVKKLAEMLDVEWNFNKPITKDAESIKRVNT